MARPTMARLIDRVRGLTYAGTAEYTVGTVNYFSDDHIQTYLDDHREDVWREAMEVEPTYESTGVVYKVYELERTEWESTDGGTAVFYVQDVTGTTIGTANYTVDYQRGYVTFATDRGGTAYFSNGRVYDIYAAAADLLTAWAAREARQFDVSTPAVNAKRSQKADYLLKMASQYRAMSSGPGAEPGSGGGVSLYRSDMG